MSDADADYKRTENSSTDAVPIVKDGAKVESGLSKNPDSDEALAKDDLDVDESNIIDEKTRGAKPTGSYKEPGDTEGLPEDDGTSAVANDQTKS